MVRCLCGRSFGSEHALQQHRRDNARLICASSDVGDKLKAPESSPQGPLEVSIVSFIHPLATQLRNQRSQMPEWFKGLAPRDKWMVKVIGGQVQSISRASLQLSGSETQVSSSGHAHVICSYDWVQTDPPTVYVPGTNSHSVLSRRVETPAKPLLQGVHHSIKRSPSLQRSSKILAFNMLIETPHVCLGTPSKLCFAPWRSRTRLFDFIRSTCWSTGTVCASSLTSAWAAPKIASVTTSSW